MTSPDGEGVPNNADEKEKGDDQKPFATVVVEMNLVFMLKKKCNQEKQKENGQVFHKIKYTGMGAEGGNRTHTILRSRLFESRASTSFATSAGGLYYT